AVAGLVGRGEVQDHVGERLAGGRVAEVVLRALGGLGVVLAGRDQPGPLPGGARLPPGALPLAQEKVRLPRAAGETLVAKVAKRSVFANAGGDLLQAKPCAEAHALCSAGTALFTAQATGFR